MATGAVAQPLVELTGRAVVGVDLALPMLRHSSGRLPGRVVQGDARRLPFAGGAVDAVVLCWVLHLAGDVDASVGEAARVLRPGGRAFVFEGDNIEEGDAEPPAMYARLGAAAGRRSGDERWQDAVDAVRRAGLVVVHEARTPPRRWTQSPMEAADLLRRRLAGFLDRMDDATFERLVEPVIDELLTMPDAEVPRERIARHRCLVVEKPG